MKSKIFKALLITIAIVTGLQGLGMAQTMTAEQQKDLEIRMKQMELKLQQMQVKLDSMKLKEKTYGTTVYTNGAYGDGSTYSTTARAYKVAPRVAIPRTPAPARAPLATLAPLNIKGFKAFSKPMKFEGYHDTDKEIEEKVKSGEVKQKTKSFTKSYSIGKEDKLSIDNQYGSVTINTWNKNEFKVDVEIKSDADDDDKAQKLLDNITIEDSKDGSTVAFATKIGRQGETNWFGTMNDNGKTSIRKAYINYTVYMPGKNALQLNNRFGHIDLPDFDGKLTITGMYSNITAKKLTNTANDINNRFSNTTIESLNGGNLKINYGNLNLGTSDNLNADISMASAKVSKLKSAANISTRYGSLDLTDIDKNLKSLSLKSSFTDVSVNVNNNQNFDFDVTVSNTNFDYGNHDITVTSTVPDSDTRRWTPTKNYKGHLGKGDTEKVLTIKANYGSVKFNLQ
jgi:hypothetical protein